jgi:hypothetical protein
MNVQICKFADVRMLCIFDYYISLDICTSAYLYLYINKKSPLVGNKTAFKYRSDQISDLYQH